MGFVAKRKNLCMDQLCSLSIFSTAYLLFSEAMRENREEMHKLLKVNPEEDNVERWENMERKLM